MVGHKTTVTVTVTAIDPKTGSVTFMGPRGNSETVKVRHPEKLQGVAVGDSVEITYSEALAVKVEEAPKKM
jgi:ribosomal protein L35AE/L33A